MDYTLHQLKVFLKVVHTQSVTKASEELFLTQPAVSIQLRKFQDQFSVPLFEVVGRQLYITDFGKEIAVAAERILNEVEAINYRTLAYSQQLAGRLKVSVVSTGKYVMPYFLSEFMRKHKGVDLIMDVTNKSRVISNLEENEVDFSLVSVLPAHLSIDRLELLQNKLYLVGSPQLRALADSDKKDFLQQYPLIYREQGSATRNAMESFIRSKSISTYKKLELTSNEAVKQAVIAGLGYSIMPLIGLRNELRNGQLEIIPLKGLPIVTRWNLIWLKGKNLSPVAQGYLDFLKQKRKKLVEEHFHWYEQY
ncbi:MULTISPECIES: LysR family transcriptional regulator [Roseivirga]|jgi:DNA-binding transcriptional LysR family regulator|uniref:Transcriptional regulator n=1 Tax=Roseivirga thermotolerans TaxID=1758176 RepID=A0ABQ3I7W0_9BACT|nr:MULTISPECIES: LysR family transcriptional regulator [Roseivirga]GHE59057.1 transcriptional regulator [Roseivirga thermotolerans]|tara:strand:- start:41981 stop:42904 length:924 start_codon:yes stop_codon:yes gene_type:complete